MPACRRPRIFGRFPRVIGADDGFTLLEVMIAMAVISTMMLSLGSFFTISSRVIHQQSDRQAAIQAVDDAMERARAIQVSALLTDRDADSTMAQVAAAPDEVKALLTDGMNNAAVLSDPVQAQNYLAWDAAAASGAGATAALPTTFTLLTLSGITYKQQWFIGKCGRATPDQDHAPEDAERPCEAGKSGSNYTPLYRIVVAVGWTDRICPAGCTFVSTSLISSKTEEPVFSIRDSISRVKITSVPGAQADDISVPVSLAFTASGTDVTWSATGLPAGLTINPATGVVSGTPTTAASNTAMVTASDAYAQEDYVSFTWVINNLPTITSSTPSTISSPGSVAYTRTFTVTKSTGTVPYTGTAPYTWSWSGAPTATWPAGTPPGLTLDPSTGVASGTPNVSGSNSVTITVTDKYNQVATKAITWTVAALSVNSFSVPTSKKNTAITPVTVTAAGGIPPYVSWSATGLPDGLSISSTGTISGTPLTKATFTNVVITVTDSSANATARTASRTIATWTVT